jgi:protocatechuate 3,4-dioxygenase beta subunit
MLAACVTPVITPAPAANDALGDPESATVLEPTLSCGDDDEPTIAQTAGPYYTPNSPERTSFLEEGMTGTNLLLNGYVLTTGCTPVARALVDFWHCDEAGVYDNTGYRLRGHQFTDEQGRYQLASIVPGIYPGRTRHIHVKVQAPNGPVLTTQLYFPNVPDNASDGIFHPSLVVEASEDEKGMSALFNFVLA